MDYVGTLIVENRHLRTKLKKLEEKDKMIPYTEKLMNLRESVIAYIKYRIDSIGDIEDKFFRFGEGKYFYQLNDTFTEIEKYNIETLCKIADELQFWGLKLPENGI